jgi:quinol monooxygenase YgiN
MIVIQGYIDIDVADRDAAAVLAQAMHDASQAEPGCLTYRIAEEIGRPGRFWVIEAWAAAEAVEIHGASAHMAAYRAGLAELRVTGRELWRYEVTTRDPMG